MSAAPIEPPPSTFAFPPVSAADERGRVTTGGDLEPGTLLLAYRSGMFPMRTPLGELTWWSPDPRGIVALDAVRISRSLRKSMKRFRTTVDTAFSDVVSACAHRAPGEYVWITDEVRAAYVRLHELGWAHSIETRTVDTNELVGGLYGVAIGGLFAGESMFSRKPDASKVAYAALAEILIGAGEPEHRMIDVQWLTPHLASLGAIEVARDEFLRRLDRALALPEAPGLTRP